jgi:Uncharacterized protein conserved in bacteria
MKAIPAMLATVLLAAPIALPRDYSIHAVPMTAVTIDDGFWAPKLEVNRTVTIPHILKENDDTGRVANFEKAAGRKTGAYEGRRFNDTDIYKIIEAASYSLALVPDPRLGTKLDELIQLIAESQEKDGYLFPARTIDPQHPAPVSVQSGGFTRTAATSCTTRATCTRRRSHTSKRPASGRCSTSPSRTPTSCAGRSGRTAAARCPATRKSSSPS